MSPAVEKTLSLGTQVLDSGRFASCHHASVRVFTLIYFPSRPGTGLSITCLPSSLRFTGKPHCSRTLKRCKRLFQVLLFLRLSQLLTFPLSQNENATFNPTLPLRFKQWLLLKSNGARTTTARYNSWS